MKSYGIFGANIKEPPQITSARAIIGLGRNATSDEIKNRYRQLSMRWHPDKHMGKCTEKEAAVRFRLYSTANELLSKESSQIKANADFQKALEEPFIVGDRVFCLGSLYGTRIFIPKESKGPAITDPSKLLGGSKSPFTVSFSELQNKQYFGIRSSIMESSFADTLEMFYGGKVSGAENDNLLVDAFVRKQEGGLDDLVWIRDNELGINDFLNRDFRSAAGKFSAINSQVRENIIFMFRYGVCLEAMAAEPIFKQSQPEMWQKSMGKAINLYEKCLNQLESRDISYPEYEEVRNRWHDPTSLLTVMMQAADAYNQVGKKDSARKLWHKVRSIDPNCYEAQANCSNLSIKLNPKRWLMLLTGKR